MRVPHRGYKAHKTPATDHIEVVTAYTVHVTAYVESIEAYTEATTC